GGELNPGVTDTNCISVHTTLFPPYSGFMTDCAATNLLIDHISHGGQLGAPFSQMDCGTVLCNPCIRGEWQHTRHYQGKGNPKDVIDMNIHSVNPQGCFDSLACACLGCCADGVFHPANTN